MRDFEHRRCIEDVFCPHAPLRVFIKRKRSRYVKVGGFSLCSSSSFNRRNIYQRKLRFIDIFKACQKCICRIQGCQAGNTCFDGGTADEESIVRMLTLFWNVNDKVNLMSKQKVHQCRRFLLDLIDADDIHAGFFQRLLGSSCCINFIAKCFKTFCYRNGIRFILVSYRKDHLLVLRKIDTGSHKRFGKCFIECLRDSETFTG